MGRRMGLATVIGIESGNRFAACGPGYSVGTAEGRVRSVAGNAHDSSVAAAESAQAYSAVPGSGPDFPHGAGC